MRKTSLLAVVIANFLLALILVRPAWCADISETRHSPSGMVRTLREISPISSPDELNQYGATLYKLATHPESDPQEVIDVALNEPNILPPLNARFYFLPFYTTYALSHSYVRLGEKVGSHTPALARQHCQKAISYIQAYFVDNTIENNDKFIVYGILNLTLGNSYCLLRGSLNNPAQYKRVLSK